MVVIGRDADESGETVDFGHFRAPDGSYGAGVELDCEFPHAGIVVGKRGYGKSYTLGVIAEGLAGARGVAPVVVDPLGVFTTLDSGAVPASVVAEPRVAASTLPPRAWCDLVGLAPDSAAGAVVWQAAAGAETLAGMRRRVEDLECGPVARRTARNHLTLAESWDVFAPAGLDATDLATGEATVLDLAGTPETAMNAVVRAVATGLYEARVAGNIARLPWLLCDEAHVFFDGVAAPALQTLLTRGRQPGVSLLAATQRPDAVPTVAISQSDLVIAHRLTDRADRDALDRARPAYAADALTAGMPTRPGDVTVVDDTGEAVHAVRVRERTTPHGGSSPRAGTVDTGGEAPQSLK
ncbi:ATP-binding protein [Haloarchaeobius sp. HME9146]|uniref:ATP-binding protein n=1 Tax=Haloarchaeobius sp. HME9146 TaxID=2978732 RepID=UPI0021C07286|nr:ATPase [Haloarchaeobius sp. HME9146]MCT9095324.1 ATPase [Haloarchaeobius sp. HME9146]